MPNATPPRRTTVATSGLVTGLSLAAVTGLSAVVGVVIARQFGRGVETDGFFAAYGLYVVLVLAATASRVVVLPTLARAAQQGRLAEETAGYAATLVLLAAPVLALALLAPGWIADQLTAELPAEASATARDALVWMVPAAVAQLYAGLAASALAALDDYVTAAAGYAAGSLAALAVIAVRIDDGIVAVAWAMAVNGAVALAVPAGVLAARAGLRTVRPRALAGRPRLAELARGVALPLALQGLFVVALRLAGGVGVGAVTSLGYAFLIASALVSVTASAFGLASSVPLARRGLEGGAAARHVVSTTWLSLAVVAGAAGVLALAGEGLLDAVLGDEYGGDVGAELGRLVVYLAPWMVASVGVSVTFPLLFVAGRARRLPVVAAAALAVHVPLEWAARELLGLPGIAAGLALTTSLVFAALLWLLSRETLADVGRGLVVPAAVVAALATVSFGGPGLVAGGAVAAVAGLAAYVGLVAVVRPRGLVDAWAYVRALH